MSKQSDSYKEMRDKLSTLSEFEKEDSEDEESDENESEDEISKDESD